MICLILKKNLLNDSYTEKLITLCLKMFPKKAHIIEAKIPQVDKILCY